MSGYPTQVHTVVLLFQPSGSPYRDWDCEAHVIHDDSCGQYGPDAYCMTEENPWEYTGLARQIDYKTGVYTVRSTVIPPCGWSEYDEWDQSDELAGYDLPENSDWYELDEHHIKTFFHLLDGAADGDSRLAFDLLQAVRVA